MMAAGRGVLDLSECDLQEVPLAVFDVPGLKVHLSEASRARCRCSTSVHPVALLTTPGDG